LKEKFPEEVETEQVLDMFDFAQSKKFIKEGTISLRAAEAENEMLLQNKPVQDPEDYEDQIVHWKTHVKAMRQWSYKNRAPAEVKKLMEEHVMATEMLMVEYAVKNPAFAELLVGLQGFPLFYVPQMTPEDTIDPLMITPEPMPGGELPPEAQEALPEDFAPEEMATQMPGEPTVEPGIPPLDQQNGSGGPLPPIEPTSSI